MLDSEGVSGSRHATRRSEGGVRSISFERRIIIFYRVQGSIVEVLRIVSTAREHRTLLG